MLTGYQLYANTDMDEGRGTPVPIPGIFVSEEAATAAAVGRGVYGSPADIKPVPLFESVHEYTEWEREQDPDWRMYIALKKKFEDQ